MINEFTMKKLKAMEKKKETKNHKPEENISNKCLKVTSGSPSGEFKTLSSEREKLIKVYMSGNMDIHELLKEIEKQDKEFIKRLLDKKFTFILNNGAVSEDVITVQDLLDEAGGI